MFPISEAGEDDFLPGGENGARSSPFSVEWCGTLCRAGRTTVRRFRSMRVRRELFVTGGQGAVCVKRKTGGVAVFYRPLRRASVDVAPILLKENECD